MCVFDVNRPRDRRDSSALAIPSGFHTHFDARNSHMLLPRRNFSLCQLALDTEKFAERRVHDVGCVRVVVANVVAGPEQVPSSRARVYVHDYTRRCNVVERNIRGIPRRVEHEITRNEMTHPPRIISRKRLIKVHGSARCTRTKLDPPSHIVVRVRTHGYTLTRARARTHTQTHRPEEVYPAVFLLCMLYFPPRSSFCPSPFSSRLSSGSRGRSGSAETASALG